VWLLALSAQRCSTAAVVLMCMWLQRPEFGSIAYNRHHTENFTAYIMECSIAAAAGGSPVSNKQCAMLMAGFLVYIVVKYPAIGQGME
jgi:hypothetical protein